jgi:hypothetical protein
VNQRSLEIDVHSRPSRLGHADLFADRGDHHLEATPSDIVYTWGPGHFIFSDSNESTLQAICVGEGIIYRKAESAPEFHREAGSGPDTLPPTAFGRHSRVIVGSSVGENPTVCTCQFNQWRSTCRLPYLGVQQERWCRNQRQLGLQIRPDHAALQGIQVWTRIPAKLLKQYQLEQAQI